MQRIDSILDTLFDTKMQKKDKPIESDLYRILLESMLEGILTNTDVVTPYIVITFTEAGLLKIKVKGKDVKLI